jgi:hypothetical protein
MEASEILRIARTDDAPEGWIVLPLRRDKVALAILGWTGAALLGAALFALFFWMVWPNNFENGVGALIFSLILLAFPTFILLGSLWTILGEVRRLRAADQHMIVITPTDYVKQQGKAIDHVPLSQIEYVTVRTRPRRAEPSEDVGFSMATMGRMLFGGFGRRQLKSPPSLAFVDARTERTVVVATDDSYADLEHLGEALTTYVEDCRANQSPTTRI